LKGVRSASANIVATFRDVHGDLMFIYCRQKYLWQN